MAQTSETLESLLAVVTELTTTLTATLRTKNLPEPSFNEDAPGSLPPDQDIQGPRTKLVGALMDMLHLAMGPNEYFITQNMWVSASKSYIPSILNFRGNEVMHLS